MPFGSIGLSVFGLDLFFAQPELTQQTLIGVAAFIERAGSIRIVADVLFIGVFGGFYFVPLFSLNQQKSEPHHLSRVIACNNIFNALLMVLSAIMAMVLLGSGVSIAELFLIVALLNAVVAVYVYMQVPEFFMRFIVWMLIHSVYHVRKRGLDNIPEQGAAMLVCNHVSYVDALIIAGCIRRPVRFVIYYKIYNLPVLNFVFRTAGAIPIAGTHENPELMDQAFSKIEQLLKQGELVCIFPDGKLTRNGKMNKFRPGIERVLETTPVTVVPMVLNGLWGSAFSRQRSNLLLRILKGIRSTVEFKIAAPVQAEMATALTLQQQVEVLASS